MKYLPYIPPINIIQFHQPDFIEKYGALIVTGLLVIVTLLYWWSNRNMANVMKTEFSLKIYQGVEVTVRRRPKDRQQYFALSIFIKNKGALYPIKLSHARCLIQNIPFDSEEERQSYSYSGKEFAFNQISPLDNTNLDLIVSKRKLPDLIWAAKPEEPLSIKIWLLINDASGKPHRERFEIKE